MGAIIARGGDFPRDLRFLRDWVLGYFLAVINPSEDEDIEHGA